jgi:NAD(P)-dependent dehydrogenase (short-subunit alcohol dehydrogenase family)
MKKHAMVTGAAGSLGLSVTNRLLQEGYQIEAFISPWDEIPKSLENEQINIHRLDLCDETLTGASIAKVFAQPITRLLVVMCAGGFDMDTYENTSYSSFDTMLQKNFVTAFNTSTQTLRKAIESSTPTKMIFIGSKQALYPDTGTYARSYTLSKSLLVPLARMINAEGSSRNISAHIIAPSIIDTPANREAMGDADTSQWVKPEVIINTVLFLESPDGRNITQTSFEIFNKS